MKKDINYYSEKELKRLGFKKIGKKVKISKKSSIYYPKNISIGDYSRIDDFAVISGKIKIGKNVHLTDGLNCLWRKKSITFKDFSGMAFGSKIIGISDDYSGKNQ